MKPAYVTVTIIGNDTFMVVITVLHKVTKQFASNSSWMYSASPIFVFICC
jgi:hypothetical protein